MLFASRRAMPPGGQSVQLGCHQHGTSSGPYGGLVSKRMAVATPWYDKWESLTPPPPYSTTHARSLLNVVRRDVPLHDSGSLSGGVHPSAVGAHVLAEIATSGTMNPLTGIRGGKDAPVSGYLLPGRA
jgi:hypothetical protein